MTIKQFEDIAEASGLKTNEEDLTKAFLNICNDSTLTRLAHESIMARHGEAGSPGQETMEQVYLLYDSIFNAEAALTLARNPVYVIMCERGEDVGFVHFTSKDGENVCYSTPVCASERVAKLYMEKYRKELNFPDHKVRIGRVPFFAVPHTEVGWYLSMRQRISDQHVQIPRFDFVGYDEEKGGLIELSTSAKKLCGTFCASVVQTINLPLSHELVRMGEAFPTVEKTLKQKD